MILSPALRLEKITADNTIITEAIRSLINCSPNIYRILFSMCLINKISHHRNYKMMIQV